MTETDSPIAGVDQAGLRHKYAGPGVGGVGRCACGWEPDPSWSLGGNEQFAMNAHVAWICDIKRDAYERPRLGGRGISDDVLGRLVDLSAQRIAHERALDALRAAQLPLIDEALAQARYGDMARLMAATGYSREYLNTINTRRRAREEAES
jgi:hypothetical protein